VALQGPSDAVNFGHVSTVPLKLKHFYGYNTHRIPSEIQLGMLV
jgi:hypothetical protein